MMLALPSGSQLVDARRRPGRGIGIALRIGREAPKIGGRRGVERGERTARASSVPSLLMATPWLVPFSNSSYLVCSQVRVPCAQHIAASNGQKSASRSHFMSLNWPIGRNKKRNTGKSTPADMPPLLGLAGLPLLSMFALAIHIASESRQSTEFVEFCRSKGGNTF